MKGESVLRALPVVRSHEEAEALAVDVLGALASDAERLGAFLAASGLHPAALREAAREPGFLAAVLDYVASDEDLLVTLAQELGQRPERLASAQQRLSPPPPDDG